jgi:hypothetical protein
LSAKISARRRGIPSTQCEASDDDFRSLALVRGAPPKVVWLQIGNASTSRVADLLHANALLLKTVSLDPVEALLSLRAWPHTTLSR